MPLADIHLGIPRRDTVLYIRVEEEKQPTSGVTPSFGLLSRYQTLKSLTPELREGQYIVRTGHSSSNFVCIRSVLSKQTTETGTAKKR